MALSCPEAPIPTQPYPVPQALTCEIGIARQLILSRAHPRLSALLVESMPNFMSAIGSTAPAGAGQRCCVDPASKTARGKVISAGSRRGSASSIRVPRGRYPSRQRCPGLLRPPCSNAVGLPVPDVKCNSQICDASFLLVSRRFCFHFLISIFVALCCELLAVNASNLT